MTQEWYWKLSSGELGPLSPAQLKSLAAEGRISPGDSVRLGTDGKWLSAAHVHGLVFQAVSLVPVASKLKDGGVRPQNSSIARPSVTMASHSTPPPLPVSQQTRPLDDAEHAEVVRKLEQCLANEKPPAELKKLYQTATRSGHKLPDHIENYCRAEIARHQSLSNFLVGASLFSLIPVCIALLCGIAQYATHSISNTSSGLPLDTSPTGSSASVPARSNNEPAPATESSALPNDSRKLAAEGLDFSFGLPPAEGPREVTPSTVSPLRPSASGEAGREITNSIGMPQSSAAAGSPPLSTTSATDTNDVSRLDALRRLCPMVVNGASLAEVYNRYPEARKAKLQKIPDGSQEVLWGGGLIKRHVALGGGKVVLCRWEVLHTSREVAEKELLSFEDTFGGALITTLPNDEPEMIACSTWVFSGFLLRVGVVRGTLSNGEHDVYYLQTLVMNEDAITNLINNSPPSQEPRPRR